MLHQSNVDYTVRGYNKLSEDLEVVNQSQCGYCVSAQGRILLSGILEFPELKSPELRKLGPELRKIWSRVEIVSTRVEEILPRVQQTLPFLEVVLYGAEEGEETIIKLQFLCHFPS